MDHHNSHQCPYCRAHLSPRELHQCQHVEKRITSATRKLQQLLLTPTWDPSLIKAFQKFEREKEKEVQLSKLRRPLPSSPFSAASPSPPSSASSISPLPFSPSLSSASTVKTSLQCPYCGEPCVPNLMHYCRHIEPLVTPRSNQPSPETVVFNKKQTYIKSVKESAEKLPTTTARNNCPALSASADDGETNDSLIPLKKQCFQLSDIFVNDDDDDDDHPMMVVETEFQSSTAAAAVSGTAVIRTTTTTNKARKKRKREKEQHHKITRLYRCDFCPKHDFADFAQYMGHRLVHISERPHQCNQCSSAFARRSTLIRHIKESHSSSYSPATFTAILQTPNQFQKQQQQQQSESESDLKAEAEAELDPGLNSKPELRINQESEPEDRKQHHHKRAAVAAPSLPV